MRFVRVFRSACMLCIPALATGVPIGRVAGQPPKLIDRTPPENLLLGASTAQAKIDVVLDLEAPGSRRVFDQWLPELRSSDIATGKLQIRLRQFPLTVIHANTLVAHIAATCLSRQTNIWPVAERLVAAQEKWGTVVTSNPKPIIDSIIQPFIKDRAQFRMCMNRNSGLEALQAEVKELTAREVRSVPTGIIGSRLLPGLVTVDSLRRLLNLKDR